ncbi:MAG: SAM-dependent methyltransferase, partial [Bacteroidota bacterium]|nr:SAM-dependent methyltransferase [Bacteroidota bacterium]
FIDTLSFEKHNKEQPWIAYRQFCENFLSPLLLMHYSKNSLQQLLLAYPDGIPLAVTKSLLPWRSKLSLHTYLHIHLHAVVAQKKAESNQKKIKFSKQKLLNLVSSLETLIRRLKLPAQKSIWFEYYDEALQRKDYLQQKRKLIQQLLDKLGNLKTAADLGANNGEFSQLLSAKNIQTIAADSDPCCINKLYTEIKKSAEKNIQPLVVDLSNPSPAVGFNNAERASFLSRTRVDLVLALALVHHLAIGKNIPLDIIACFFKQLSKHLIIEFVPKQDEKVQLMLSVKKDIYTEYDEAGFEQAFKKYYSVVSKESIAGSGRVLYLMSKHED